MRTVLLDRDGYVIGRIDAISLDNEGNCYGKVTYFGLEDQSEYGMIDSGIEN